MSGRFSCQQIRDIVKARGHLLDAGFDWSAPEVEALEIIRDEYRQRVGVETYLAEMLSQAERCAMKMCSARWPDGRQLCGWDLTTSQRRQRCWTWLCEHCRVDDLPYRLEVRLGGGHVAVRYL